jgi:methylmalonyl-CoA mutase C-terminal domain/subunit
MSAAPLRILLAKLGLDGHDRGLKVVAVYLRDAGMDVVYLGIHCTADRIVRAAIEEDVDLIGVSSLGGTHRAHGAALIAALREQGLGELPVVIGGTIPVEDIADLERCGFRGVMRPGSSRDEIVELVRTEAEAGQRRLSRA